MDSIIFLLNVNVSYFTSNNRKLSQVYNIPSPPLSVHSDAEDENVDAPDAEVVGHRFARDVLDHVPVNDYVSAPPRHPGTARRDAAEPLQSAPALPRLFLHINRSLIDVKTDFVHQRA